MVEESAGISILPAHASTFSLALGFSGFLGIAVAFVLEAYRLFLTDPVIGSGSIPTWIEPASTGLLLASLVVLVYARVFDEYLGGFRDIVLVLALVGQWGRPLFLFLDHQLAAFATEYRFLALVSTILFAISTIVMAIGYARNTWPGGTVGADETVADSETSD